MEELTLTLIREHIENSLLSKDYLCRDMFNELIKCIKDIKSKCGVIFDGCNDKYTCQVCGNDADADDVVCENLSIWCKTCNCRYILCCNYNDMLDSYTDWDDGNIYYYISNQNSCVEIINETLSTYKIFFLKITHIKHNKFDEQYIKLDYSKLELTQEMNDIHYKAICDHCKKEHTNYLGI